MKVSIEKIRRRKLTLMNLIMRTPGSYFYFIDLYLEKFLKQKKSNDGS